MALVCPELLPQSFQHLLRLFFKSPEFLQQLLRGNRGLVAVEVFVWQDLIAKLRAVFPADDRLGDFPFQERLDVFTVGDELIILYIVAMGPLDAENLRLALHQILELAAQPLGGLPDITREVVESWFI